jgi:hypothetical protein
MKQLLKYFGLCCVVLLTWFCSSAQSNITRVEYYIDTDPGYGTATAVSITPGINIVNQTININPLALSVGTHLIGLRALDESGNWSLSQKWLFIKPPTTLTAPQIKTMKQVEYYIDIDPGWGNGVPVAIQNNITNLSDIQISTNVTGLTAGLHNFFIRGLDSSGAWSLSDTLQFNIPALLNAPAITVNSVVAKTSNCARDSFNISYDATGTYSAGNLFKAELSDANGSFSSPTVIGSYTGTNNSIIKVQLPSHLADGTNYKIRVSSTSPVVTGVASTNAITIRDRPVAQTITGAINANATFSYPYSVPSFTGSAWSWIAPSATITETANSADLLWNVARQPDTIQVVETNQYGCVGDTSMANVNVYTLKIDNVAASSLTPCPASAITVTADATGVYDAANKFTVQLSDASGNFASPVNIGSLPANPIGLLQPISIAATLPYPLLNDTGYLIRITASSPSVTSSDNGQDITINKPNLGADTSITISCANGSADITTLYNTTALTTVYSTATPAAATPGVYNLFVTNSNGCKDSAVITVLDASTATVPAAGSNTKIANRECTDAQGWTHYYNDNGTPADYSDDIRLLSIRKNGNNIGTVGDGTFQLTVAATAGAGSNHAVKVNSPLLTNFEQFYSMNRYWNITPTTQPASVVGVRFYYNTQDLADVNGDYPSAPITDTQLSIYKLQNGNPDPTTNWLGATANTFYANGSTPDLNTWVYTDLGNNRHQAEFEVSSFSGGGAGAIVASALPVTFLSFNVTALKDKVELIWATAIEINSKDFKVQRSLDGNNFEDIATVAAAGNSNNLRNYVFDDIQRISLKGEIVFYRIAEEDIDGKLLYTNVKSVKIPDGKNKLTLGYNPVRNEALLKYDCVENDRVKIRMVDQLGRVMLIMEQTVQAGSNEIKMETATLAKGIYEVELTGAHDHEVVRMMKE